MSQLPRRTPAARNAVRRRRDGPVPLSYQQQRLWFVEQLVPGSPAYVLYIPLRVRGRLDTAAMARAINEISRRHEVLRSAFTSTGDGPVQQITPPRDVVTTMPAPGCDDARLSEILAAESRLPFSLEDGPLFRALIVELSELDHVVMLSAHHAVVDGWSVGIILRELGELYSAYAEGAESPLTELSLQYADFALWQREAARKESGRHLRYWAEHLAGAPEVIRLPTDRPRPDVQAFRGTSLVWEVPADLALEVRAWCRRRGVTAFAGYLAAFFALLYRYSEQDTIVAGTPIANRTRVEFEDMVGFFANTLVLRADLNAGLTAADLLAQVRDRTLDAQEHQDVPFERLVDELGVPRKTGQNPIFQVLFAFQNVPQAPIEFPGLQAEIIDAENDTSKFDLSLHITDAPGKASVEGLIEFNTDLFDKATVERMVRHYQNLLRAMAGDDSARICRLPMLDEDEYEQLVTAVNDTAVPMPDSTLDDLIGRQVSATPDALAVRCPQAAGISSLTFAELDARARYLASRLLDLGLSRGDVVATWIPRSAELVIAIVAILRCGGVYCPLDGELPAERLSYLLADSGARIVISRDAVAGIPAGTRTLLLEPRMPGSAADAPPIESGHDSSDPCYLIYTSGSMGQPKGALTSHQAAVNRLVWMRDLYRIGPGDKILHKTSCGFDVSVWELILPLITGASMIILPPGQHRDPALVAGILDSEGATVTHFVPSALGSFLESPELPDLSHLRYVFSSGEALPLAIQERFRERLPGAELHNLYGPTEAAIDVTRWKCQPVPLPVQTVPIGYPVANTQVYVLDRWLNPVPEGFAGELYLGGVQLALGYREKPAITASRFVANPFGKEAGQRLYRTGDLVRYRPATGLEFLGRTDHQVKLRGYRIEPGEIEHVLTRCPGVSQALVMLTSEQDQTDGDGGYDGPAAGGRSQITAYLVAARDPDSSVRGQQVASSLGHWTEVWDATYAPAAHTAGRSAHDAESDPAGWVDSYSGRAFSAQEMSEYITGAAGLIGPDAGGAILEIGAGSGQLLAEIAPHSREYWATDFSPNAIEALRRLAGGPGLQGTRTVIGHQAADDVTGIPERYFDAVLLASVVQYFPSPGYLTRVLDLAVSRLRPGGRLIVGDVRNLSLADAFYASVEMARTGDPVAPSSLREDIRRRRREESELLVDPAFFDEFCAQREGLQAEVRLKPGTIPNELTKYRYDVIVHKTPDSGTEAAAPFVDLSWSKFSASPEDLWLELAAGTGGDVVVRGIANRRVLGDVRLADAAVDAGQPAGQRPGERDETAQDPGTMAERARGAGYQMAAWWAGRELFDAVFWKGGEPPLAARRGTRARGALASEPLRAQRNSLLADSARQWTRRYLPDYMVPASFVIMDEFPLGPNGKVDRKELPLPGRSRMAVDPAFRPAVTPLEQHLASIWAQLLETDRIGLDDNFFELGGDSILSVRVVNRAAEEGVRLTVRELFDHPTVGALAALIEGRGGTVGPESGATWLELLPEQRALLDSGPRRVRHGITLARPLRADLLTSAVEVATHVHDALRLHLDLETPNARQRVLPAQAAGNTITIVPAGAPPGAADGSLATLVLRDDDRQQCGELDLWADPLVFDRASVWLFLRTIESACLSLEAGTVPDPPRPGGTFASRCHALPGEAADSGMPAAGSGTSGRDKAAGVSRRAHTRRMHGDHALRLLADATSVYGNRPDDLVLCAVALAWAGSGGDEMVALLERDERRFADDRHRADGIIGPFTMYRRVALPAAGAADPGVTLRKVKESLREVPVYGGAADISVRCADERASARGVTLFGPREDDDPADYDLCQRGAPVGLTLRIHDDSISMRWSGSGDLAPGFLEELADRFAGQLSQLLDQCALRRIGGFAEGEFPLAALAPDRLAELSDRFPGAADVYPLGPFQRHMARRLALDPRPGLYLVWGAFTLQDLDLDVDAFLGAWQDVMDRHAALRTGFLWTGDEQPMQIVHGQSRVPVDREDLRDLPAGQQDARFGEYLRQTGQHRLDMSGEVQWRLGIFRTAEDTYRFVTRFSYMVQDGWTFSIVLDDLLAYYQARRSGETLSLPALRPYRDHIAALQRADHGAAEEFWANLLSGVPLPTPLVDGITREYGPADDTGGDFEYRTEWIVIDKPLEYALRAFARRHRLTVFTLLEGAWAVLVSRYSGAGQVVFGTVSSGRPEGFAGVEHMTGSFNNIVPLVIGLPDDEPVVSWLHGVQAATMAATRFEQTSLADIQRLAGVPAGDHLVESYLVFENFPMGEHLRDLNTEWQAGDEGATQTEHPLRVFIWPLGTFSVEISYYTNVLSTAAIRGILRTYLECLRGLLAAEKECVEDLVQRIGGVSAS